MAIIDLIEYVDEPADELAHRIPEYGSGEFRLGSQCVVRESQRAVFVRDGKALDVLPPGRHTLSTANIPILAELLGLPFGGKSPFRAEVFYVSVREFTDMKWGTPQPVLYRDKEFGMIRVRAFGTYSLRVKDPQLFVTQVVGTRGSYTTADIEEFLRSIVVNEFNDMLGETLTSLLDVQGTTMELASAALHALTDDFDRLGLDLRTFQVTAITPPDEVQKVIDERSSMGVIGDMRTYTQYQTAQAIGGVGEAGGEGSGGGDLLTGAGLGAGIGLGAAMSEAIRDSMRGSGQQTSTQPPAAGGATAAGTATAPGARFCPNCGNAVGPSAKFCSSCGFNLQATTACPNCGTQNPAGSKFCQECGTTLSS
jgi:membrane protease subunit (stomatin/prohibitin family)